LKLAGESRAVLKGERRIALRVWQEPKRSRRAGRAAAVAGGLPAEAQALFERLRAWRLEAAARHGVPAYVIFHDATLKEIARLRPASLDALHGIPGIGAKKLEAYGADIVRLVRTIEG
jgi:ATP-dependent DNA helicase RecQ